MKNEMVEIDSYFEGVREMLRVYEQTQDQVGRKKLEAEIVKTMTETGEALRELGDLINENKNKTN